MSVAASRKHIFIVHAVVLPVMDVMASGAASVRAGVIEVVPRVVIDLGYDDNIYRQEENAEGSWLTQVKPGIALLLQDADNSYQLDYQVVAGRYSNNSDDDFLDQQLDLAMHFQGGIRHAVDIHSGYKMGHDQRGSGFSEGGDALVFDEADRWGERVFGGEYSFGATGAKGRLTLKLDRYEKKYINHRLQTRARDYKKNAVETIFSWRIMPKTTLLTSATGEEFSYDYVSAGDVALDSWQSTAALALTWEATRKTIVSIKGGYLKKDFDAELREDFSGANWRFDINWQPMTYSAFSFYAGRALQEAFGSGDFIDTTEYVFNWRHHWTSVLSSEVGGSLVSNRYGGIARKDEQRDYNVALYQRMTSQLSLGLAYDYERRDSNQQGLSYQRNSLSLIVEFGL